MTIAEHREDLRDALRACSEPGRADGQEEAGAGEHRDQHLLHGTRGEDPLDPEQDDAADQQRAIAPPPGPLRRPARDERPVGHSATLRSPPYAARP